ncbi:MAG: VOC family protein [Candidatus Limnocylindria bacterium]
MGHPVMNFEINSADPARARAFYTEVLGWKMNFMSENNYTFVDTDASGKGIGGGIGPLRGPTPFVTFYVVVDDVGATVQKAARAGGKVVFPATKVGPTTTIALFSDIDGNVIGLTDGK